MFRPRIWKGVRLRRLPSLPTIGLLLIIGLLVEHPVIGLLIAAPIVALCCYYSNRFRPVAVDLSTVDTMTGPAFERYVADLLRRSGCRRVRVSGGSGDMGADVTAYSPSGRRIVVQCKRYRGRLGSPDVQRFAGTARQIHGADEALLVTTGIPTAQAEKVAGLCHITLIDRAALSRWITTGKPPITSW
jgi:restriction system protein